MSSALQTRTAPNDRDNLLVLEKGLAVIECFDGHERLTIADVARMTGLSRAAARRCLVTLDRLHYAHFDGKAYSLAPRVLRLGYAYLSEAAVPQLVAPLLQRTGTLLGESCSASMLDGHEIIYVARSVAERLVAVDLRVGARLPAFCTAMGRVLLAGLPHDEARRLLEASPRPALTPRTLTRLDDILRDVEQVATQGYSLVEGELEPGLLSLAIPLAAMNGTIVAAVNVSSHTQRTSAASLLASALPALQQLQADLRPLLRAR